MLRVSGEIDDQPIDLHAVTEGKVSSEQIPAAEALNGLVEAVLQRPEDLDAAREELREQVGDAGLADAAAVIGNFQRMVRIADGTGLPLDKFMAQLSADFREDLGIDRYGSAELTPSASGPLSKIAGYILRAVAVRGMRLRRAFQKSRKQ
jgi:hypothetical protein